MSHQIHLEEKTHKYTVDGRFVPGVTSVLQAAGRINLEGIPEPILRHAAERGTRVHQAGALLLRGVLDWSSVDEEIGGYVIALDKFTRLSGFHPNPLMIEKAIYCEEFDYCGTLDVAGLFPIRARVVPIREVYAVVDWKSGMMEAVRFQLAAYARPLGIRHRLAVKLNSDGTYRMNWFPPETLAADFATFADDLKRTREAIAA